MTFSEEIKQVPLLFFIIGLILFIVGIVLIFRKRKIRKNGVLIRGFINKIYYDKSFFISLGELTEIPITITKVDVTYIFNGQQYLSRILYNQKGMKIGDMIEIFCNPYYPQNVVAKKINPRFVICAITGAIIMAISSLVGISIMLSL